MRSEHANPECACETVLLTTEQVGESREVVGVWRCQSCRAEFYPARYTRRDWDKLFEGQDLIIEMLEKQNAELRQRVES